MALTDKAIEAIKQMILDGELAPGDRLPREPDLARRLGLSRTSLREAVKALALINVLSVRQGDGTYVTSLEPGLLLETMSFAADFHSGEAVLEILQVRRLLEPPATAIAAMRMTDAEIADLADLVESMTKLDDREELIARDMEFHRRIALACGNKVLCALLDAISGRTQRARVWRAMTQRSAIEQAIDEHRSIQRAMAARDAEAARSWAEIHVAGVEGWLMTVLRDDQSGGGLKSSRR